MGNTRLGLLAACGLFVAIGCSDDPESGLPNGRISSAVIGGEASGPQYDAVVYLFVETEGGTWEECTGTLVSPRVVLTARHCVSAMNRGAFVCDAHGELVQGGSGAGVFGATYPPSAVGVFVGAIPSGEPAARAQSVFTTSAPTACRDDFAAVVLDQGIVLDSYPPIPLEREVRVGETVTVVGYGLGATATGPERRTRADVRVVDVGSEEGMGTTPPRSFALGGGTVCFGDSGGPALSTDTGALLGVYSRITGDCFAQGTWNIYMNVADYASVTERAFAVAGEAPTWEEALPDEGEPTSDHASLGSCSTHAAGHDTGRGVTLLTLLFALAAGWRQVSRIRFRGRSIP